MRSILLLLFASTAAQLLGQTSNELFVNWPADNATVFAKGAWVEHRGAVTPPAPAFELVLDGLTENVDAASLQVELPDTWRLVGSQSSRGVRPTQVAAAEQEIAALDAEIAEIRTTIAMREALHAVYSEELNMLQQNRQLSHSETLLVEDLREAAEFWRTRVKELKYKQLELGEEMTNLRDAITELQALKTEAVNRMNTTSGQVRLRLQAATQQPGAVSIRYLTQSASWRPEYDVSISSDGRIVFDRFASVNQTTGRDWEGIPLEFVVGNPMSSLAPPAFERWVLRERPVAQGRREDIGYESAPRAAQFDDGLMLASTAWMNVEEIQPPAAHAFSNDRFRFQPALPPHVGSDGQQERVFIEQFELQGELSYLLMPFASDEAYQIAHSDAWASARLMPGRVQVEAGGAFRGWFDLLLPAPGDTLVVPIGQDPEVRCSRERLADRCSNAAFGGKHKSEQTWVIEVENQHDRTITARVEDRIPVANRADLTVELLESTGAQYDAATGKLTWNITLGPGQIQRFEVRYRLEYPKGIGWVNF